MVNPVIYNIFWLPANQHFETAATAASDTAYENLMNRFAGDIGGNPYYNMLTQYPGSNGTPANAVTFGGSRVDTTAYPHAGTAADPLQDADVRAAVDRAITAQTWTADLNHIFFVYTARNIQECFSATSCTPGVPTGAGGGNFCAYHTFFGTATARRIYAFQPQVCPTRAPNPSPNGDREADSQIEVVSHELFEAVTDPLLNAWQGTGGVSAENGDLCNGQNGVTNASGANVYLNNNPYTVQIDWSNAVHGCVTDMCGTSVCPPAVSVAITGPASVASLGSATYTVTVSNSDNTAPATNVKAVLLPPVGMSPGTRTNNVADVAVRDSKQTTFTETIDSNNNLPNGSKLTVCVRIDFTNQIDGAMPSKTACMDTFVVNTPPVLTLPPTTSVAYHEPLPPLTVSATDANAGDTLTFSQSGLPANLTLTNNGNRTATIAGTPDVVPGTYPVQITVSDGHNPGVTGTFNIIVTREATTLTYSGDTKVANGTPARLAAVLREANGAPIAGRTVSLQLGAGTTAQSCTGVTQPDGTAACTISNVQQPLLGIGQVPVSASFAGDVYYLPSSTSSTVVLRYMTGRAIGLQLGVGALPLITVADTGEVITPSPSSKEKSGLSVLTLFGAVNAVTAKVVTSTAPGTATATAGLGSTSLSLPGLPVIKITNTQATAQSTCSASVGSATIDTLKIGSTVVVAATVTPAPNTTVQVAGLTVILNEQILTSDPSTGTTVLTVNAIHIKALGVDLVVSSARSDIHNC
jgi:hypothetical protein